MLPTITISDFVGPISLSANRFGAAQFTAYIDMYLEEYISNLLSPSAYVAIDTTTDAKWTLLLDGGTYSYTDDVVKTGKFSGFTNVLKFLIYFHIVRDDFTMAETGAVNNVNENSTKIKHYSIAQDRYNKAVGYYDEVKLFLERHKEITQEIATIGGNTISYYTATETLLVNGDKVCINDKEYVISNKQYALGVESFDISEPVVATSFTYNPYWQVETINLKLSYL